MSARFSMGKRLRFVSLFALVLPLASPRAALGQEPAPPPPSAPAPADPPTGDESGDEGEEVPVEDDKQGGEKKNADAETDDDESSDAEMLAELEGDDPARPPPKGKGVIWGSVKDTEFQEELVEAPVQVIGTKTQSLTDIQGRFRLELPPGTYSLRISYELHKSARIDGVVVEPGKVARLDFELTPDKDAVDVFEVIEEADKTTLEGLILARQRSTVVGDSIGRAEISKTTDRNAAQAAQRVVGATVVGGRFVYVRGLGERYTNALLNNVPLPSPEPDRAAVPLDLFPTGVLNSLTIAKTFTPDSPGDFAGGSVRIETREIPKEPVLQISARGGYNTNSTFRERLTYRGGSLDFLGLDDGTRSLPDGFPTYRVEEGFSKPDGTPVNQQDLDAAGLRLNSFMSAQKGGTPPDHGIGVVAGNGWDLGNDRKFGGLVAVNYGRGYTVRRGEIVRNFELGPTGEPEPLRDYKVNSGVDSINWGAFGSVTYRFSAQHQLSLIGIRTTLADDRAQHVFGFHSGRNQDIFATRLAFVTRALNVGILSGNHRFPDLNSAELDWNLVLSNATRAEPDRRDTVWGHGRGTAAPTYRFTDATESGKHFFSDQSETQYGGGIDFSQPVGARDTKLKLGGLVSLRSRNFEARQFRYRAAIDPSIDLFSPEGEALLAQLSCAPGQFDACTDTLFRPANIGPILNLEERTGRDDAYEAALNIYAAYVMADVGVWDDFRIIVGERIEHTYQVIDPFAQFAGEQTGDRARIRQTDVLPALSGVWSPNKKSKFRTSITRTLARPQLRELSPFTYQDHFGGPLTGGNPNLKMTRITNLDFRLEHFPTLREVLAVSLFYKSFKDPIEAVRLPSEEGTITFENAESASLIGVELEARQGLDSLSPALKDLMFSSNLTLAHSRIKIGDEQRSRLSLTNLSRPLVNQAPWVLNLSLSYARESSGTTATVLYNVIGPRIAQAASDGLDDIYEHARNVLDFTIQQKIIEHLSLKAEAKNVLNSPVLLTQGCGQRGLFGSTWHVTCPAGEDRAVSRYSEGATIALTGTYDF